MAGGGIGGSKGTSSNQTDTNSNQNQTSSTSVTLPSYLQQPVTSYFSNLGSFINSDAGTNGSQYVPAATQDQNDAYAGADNLGSYNQLYNTAAAAATNEINNPTVHQAGSTTIAPVSTSAGTTIAPTSQVQGQSVLDNLQSYMSPYIQNVESTTLANYDKQAGEQTAAAAAKAAGTGAFGDSGYRIQANDLAAQLAAQRAATDAGVLQAGYTQATGLSSADADRRQAADTTNAGNTLNLNEAQGSLTQNNNQFNAGATNTQNENQATLDQNNKQFNTTEQDTADSRQAQAEQILNQLANDQGSSQRSDIATQLAAGQDQRGVQTQQATANLTLLAQLQQILGVQGSQLLGSDSIGNATATTNSNQKGQTTQIGGGLSF